jgi:hypothetical protein
MPTVPLGIGVKCDVILAGKFGGNKWKMAMRYAEGHRRHRRDAVTSPLGHSRPGLPPCSYSLLHPKTHIIKIKMKSKCEPQNRQRLKIWCDYNGYMWPPNFCRTIYFNNLQC